MKTESAAVQLNSEIKTLKAHFRAESIAGTGRLAAPPFTLNVDVSPTAKT